MFPSYKTNKLIYKAVLQVFVCFSFFFRSKTPLVVIVPSSGLQGPQTLADSAATNRKSVVMLPSRTTTGLTVSVLVPHSLLWPSLRVWKMVLYAVRFMGFVCVKKSTLFEKHSHT